MKDLNVSYMRQRCIVRRNTKGHTLLLAKASMAPYGNGARYTFVVPHQIGMPIIKMIQKDAMTYSRSRNDSTSNRHAMVPILVTCGTKGCRKGTHLVAVETHQVQDPWPADSVLEPRPAAFPDGCLRPPLLVLGPAPFAAVAAALLTLPSTWSSLDFAGDCQMMNCVSFGRHACRRRKRIGHGIHMEQLCG